MMCFLLSVFSYKTCAVSCTGWGEKFIRNTVAFNISALMEYKGMTLAQATEGMFRGVATSTGAFDVKIWK